jgi:3-phenylpropionate/cinnamic acid dioxygenase small subunit
MLSSKRLKETDEVDEAFDIETEVRWLADRARIGDLLHQYAFGLDTRDWDSWAQLFVEDVVGEYPNATYHGRDALVAGISRVGRYAATQHLIANQQIEISKDLARSVAYLQAVHVPRADAPDEHYDMGGWYLCEHVRTPRGWRIARLTLVKSWSAGEPHRSQLRPIPDPPFGSADMDRARTHLAWPGSD